MLFQTAPVTPLRRQEATPVARLLDRLHADFAGDDAGTLADYIPELAKARPEHFGIAAATLDGHVYASGDASVRFTIQSIAKAFVFALTLDMLGPERVERAIGVEPSGEPFNSVRLRGDNRPFNPMVNSGAIACCAMLHEAEGEDAWEHIQRALGEFAGRPLQIDEAVFQSERETGDRNRAIGYLLRNAGCLAGRVEPVLDVYFRQCSLLIDARDLAVMAATLANQGINPVTGRRVVQPGSVTRTLSVMITSGMYDFAGEWTYRVGIPAKGGVGGGIIAALPAQFGLGSFSPLLDEHGNSVRGLKVCESFSESCHLHLLNRRANLASCMLAEYGIGKAPSRRNRRPLGQSILAEQGHTVRVLELAGTLGFAEMDLICRRLVALTPVPSLLVLDLRRVPALTESARRLLIDILGTLREMRVTAIFSGLEAGSTIWRDVADALGPGHPVRLFPILDEAIEWAEDQIVYRSGGYGHLSAMTDLSEQSLLRGLSTEEIAAVSSIGVPRAFSTGERILETGAAADTLFFLQSGMVSIKLGSGVRLATLEAGMAFGEMCLVEERRTADVWADTAVTCLEVPLDRFAALREVHPHVGELVTLNLASLLSKRLSQANSKLDILRA